MFHENSLASFALFCFVGAAEALAAQVSQENFDKGLIYPPFANIRKISAHIAANVAAKAYELGKSFAFRRRKKFQLVMHKAKSICFLFSDIFFF